MGVLSLVMRRGDIEFVKVGGSTLIPYRPLCAFIERLRAEQGKLA